MKITIESTDEFAPNGIGRFWKGVTASGVPCVVLVLGVGTESPEAQAAIVPELETLTGLDPARFGEVLPL